VLLRFDASDLMLPQNLTETLIFSCDLFSIRFHFKIIFICDEKHHFCVVFGRFWVVFERFWAVSYDSEHN
jgi:hypothetical protein